MGKSGGEGRSETSVVHTPNSQLGLQIVLYYDTINKLGVFLGELILSPFSTQVNVF